MKTTAEIRLVLSRRQLKVFLALALLLGGACALFSESFTLATYYPAPSGIYNRMVTTGATWLARDGGAVGVGTTSPGAKLDVEGNVKIADGTQGSGKVLTSDPSGVASWQSPAAAGYMAFYFPAAYGTSTLNLNTGAVSGGTLAFLGGRKFPGGVTAIGMAMVNAYAVGFCQQGNGEGATVNGGKMAVISDVTANVAFADSPYGCAGASAGEAIFVSQ